MSSIEWTDATWNPIVGCSRVSRGCENCYAERFVHRGMAPQHRGLTVLGAHGKGPRWTGEVRLVEERLAAPLSWRKPRRVFVNSLSDLFHEALTFEQIAAVYGVMLLAQSQTFQVLTKRPARARSFMEWLYDKESPFDAMLEAAAPLVDGALWERVVEASGLADVGFAEVIDEHAPLPNVWLGVTAEDQQRADERIPLLLDTPAALRFVSYEPALGPVDWKNIASARDEMMLPLAGLTWGLDGKLRRKHAKLDWLIVGGESGPGARPFDIEWARRTIAQCETAGVACFVKQLGAAPFYRTPIAPTAPADDRLQIVLKDRKGGDWDEWDEDLRVRQFPTVRP